MALSSLLPNGALTNPPRHLQKEGEDKLYCLYGIIDMLLRIAYVGQGDDVKGRAAQHLTETRGYWVGK